MKQLLISFIFLTISGSVLSQLNINMNDVLESDSREIKKFEYFDTSLKLNAITTIKNEIEIRLYQHVMFRARCQVLSFDGKSWSGKSTGILCYAKDSLKILNANLIFYKILDTLNQNNIFTLPNQDQLTLKGSIYDGTDFAIVYKVRNKYRCYEFSNPSYYAEMNTDVKELKNYMAIVAIMDKLFISSL